MDGFRLSGDFYFNGQNIQSTDEFSFRLGIDFVKLSKEEHVFMRSRISEYLGLKAHEIPVPWGDNPAQYEHLGFDTKPKDVERCKTMIGLLKEACLASSEDGVELKANGRRYPLDSDHPRMASINESEELRGRVKDFNALKAFIAQTHADALQDMAVTAKKKPQNPAL